MPSNCSTCNCSFPTRAAFRAHWQSSRRHQPWPYCNGCRRKFVNDHALTAHLTTSHQAGNREKFTIDLLGHISSSGSASTGATHFHCCECDRDFVNELALNQHLKDKVHALREQGFSCEECNKEFGDQDALSKHLASVVHCPLTQNLKCISGGNCRRTFTSPSAMLFHLESGSCSSGINRERIDKVISQADTGNIITSGYATNTIKDTFSYDSSMRAVPIFTDQIDDTLTSYSGALTPASDSHSIDTLTIALISEGLSCPVCPPSRTRRFITAQALRAHMTSAAHSPKIYHCPLVLVPDGDVHGGGARMPRFTTLSGLTQHLESGACRGGMETFGRAVAFVNGKLREMGFADIKLIT